MGVFRIGVRPFRYLFLTKYPSRDLVAHRKKVARLCGAVYKAQKERGNPLGALLNIEHRCAVV